MVSLLGGIRSCNVYTHFIAAIQRNSDGGSGGGKVGRCIVVKE